ncbi:hypothetical protein AWC38_SpisGene24213 [Stylophora pistillata]|uniref:C2H2-type domain-containing protein n=1 Tax=Stylophora pistillata TaxID=50429 RepID=A0A2B4R5Y9_STYPI|nr:hypothetical protein AWC38_SpisGene24213 [Stylophora pistillata]
MEDSVIDDARMIPGISKLNNFKFNPESITAWRAYEIGSGKDIRLEKQSSGGFKSLSKKHPTQTESETTEKPEVSKTHEVIAGDETAAFACPQDGCVRVFQRYSALEKHLISEKCSKSLEKRSLLDLAKIAYKSALEEGVGTIPTLQPVPGRERRTDCCNKEGWALKSTKKAYRLSEKQRAYLNAKFNLGQTSESRIVKHSVSQESREALDDGRKLKGKLVADLSHLAYSYVSTHQPSVADLRKCKMFKDLRKNKDILEPDKGNGLVVMDRKAYEQENNEAVDGGENVRHRKTCEGPEKVDGLCHYFVVVLVGMSDLARCYTLKRSRLCRENELIISYA